MFEHKNLDGRVYRVVPSSDEFIKGEVLEVRDGLRAEPEATSRRQFGVVGDRLVERCLPPETIGDCWAFDASTAPWWGSVMNPPHAGVIADFNAHNGGKQRQPLETDHNVVAFANAGEEVLFSNGTYVVTRQSDGRELQAPSILELRKLYFTES